LLCKECEKKYEINYENNLDEEYRKCSVCLELTEKKSIYFYDGEWICDKCVADWKRTYGEM
jgi:formylmethanofuran dehydrogenase subunit E